MSSTTRTRALPAAAAATPTKLRGPSVLMRPASVKRYAVLVSLRLLKTVVCNFCGIFHHQRGVSAIFTSFNAFLSSSAYRPAETKCLSFVSTTRKRQIKGQGTIIHSLFRRRESLLLAARGWTDRLTSATASAESFQSRGEIFTFLRVIRNRPDSSGSVNIFVSSE